MFRARQARDAGRNVPNPMLSDFEKTLYAKWKRDGRHYEEYASEFLGTAFLGFCVVGAVGLMFAGASPMPAAVPSTWLRLLITGFILGAVGWIVAVSPPGRLSGAHINPAVSVGFWMLGKMHFKDVLGYVLGQLAGGIVGAFLGRWTFGRLGVQVKFGALHPGESIDGALALVGEFGTTFALCAVIFTCVSRKNLMRWTPAIATVAVALLVCADGNFSGCGMNPARWLGPALAAYLWRFAWVYTAGPVLGAIAAALLHRTGLLAHPVPHTAKRYHDPRYRSIFLKDSAPSKLPDRLHRQPE